MRYTTVQETLSDIVENIFTAVYDLSSTGAGSNSTPHPKWKRKIIYGSRDEGGAHLWNDYFSLISVCLEHIFRRRFLMSRTLFLIIVNYVSSNYQYFRQRRDVSVKMHIRHTSVGIRHGS